MNLMKSALTTATGVYQYSCASSCTAGTTGGITTTCCQTDNCITPFKISNCNSGTNNLALSTSCTNSGFCKVNIFLKYIMPISLNASTR